MHRHIMKGLLILWFVLTATILLPEVPQNQGVYEYIIVSANGTLSTISDSLKATAAAEGWRVLADHSSGVPDGCSYQAQVFILFDPDYAEQLMQVNTKTAPFAVVDRLNIFQDENGTHVAMVNPHSINRTILMDDSKYTGMTETHRQKLRSMVTRTVQGEVSEKQFGQFRKKGHIGKTMGVMAGGDFKGKIKEKLVIPNSDIKTVSDKVKMGLQVKGKDMGLELIYTLDLPEYKTVIFGTSGSPMDVRSYKIVKAGSDKSRKDFAFPGTAYAAAYPIEVVLQESEEGVKVQVVNIMYRMKMYFEDAGKRAFMKNMRMPGIIEDEINNQIHLNF